MIVGKPEHDPATEALMQTIHAYLFDNRIKASIRHGRLRFSFHFYNTQEEVEKVLALLRAKFGK